jgi:hypothetical protein
MELTRAIMCPANRVAPQSIVASGERRDVFLHAGNITAAALLVPGSLPVGRSAQAIRMDVGSRPIPLKNS